MTRIGHAPHTYEWVDNWARFPNNPQFKTGFAHGDIVITANEEVITFHQGVPKVLVLDLEGNWIRSWNTPLTNAHGMALVKEGDEEFLWMADNVSGQVIKCDLAGNVLIALEQPSHHIYDDGEFHPTDVAVFEERFGGNGDVWVADGYGQNYLHRYDKAGNYLSGINGEEGLGGNFDQPHGIHIDLRKPEPELYIADRRNVQVQVFDLDGNFKRIIGRDYLVRPCGFTPYGDYMIVGELASRLTVVDSEDRLVSYVGVDEGRRAMNGWPNLPSEMMTPGRFNSPHNQAADSNGNLYVTEWLIGGRYTKLVKQNAS